MLFLFRLPASTGLRFLLPGLQPGGVDGFDPLIAKLLYSFQKQTTAKGGEIQPGSRMRLKTLSGRQTEEVPSVDEEIRELQRFGWLLPFALLVALSGACCHGLRLIRSVLSQSLVRMSVDKRRKRAVTVADLHGIF